MSKQSASKLKIGDCVVVKLPDGSTQSAKVSDIPKICGGTRFRVCWPTGPGKFDDRLEPHEKVNAYFASNISRRAQADFVNNPKLALYNFSLTLSPR